MKSKYGIEIDQAPTIFAVGALIPGDEYPLDFEGVLRHIEENKSAQKILCEGDSWFSIGSVPPHNLLHELRFTKQTVMCNLAQPSDTIRNMSAIRENPLLVRSFNELKWDAILLSGGGNDLIDGIKGIIKPPTSGDGHDVKDYVNEDLLRHLLKDVKSSFQEIIKQRNSSHMNANTPIFLHVYDYPTPRNAPVMTGPVCWTGPWLHPVMKAHVTNQNLWQPLTDYLFDRLCDALTALHDPGNKIHVIKTSGHLTRAALGSVGVSGDWKNEIHPSQAGYANLSQIVSPEIENVLRP